jgi:hypothetical protein
VQEGSANTGATEIAGTKVTATTADGAIEKTAKDIVTTMVTGDIATTDDATTLAIGDVVQEEANNSVIKLSVDVIELDVLVAEPKTETAVSNSDHNTETEGASDTTDNNKLATETDGEIEKGDNEGDRRDFDSALADIQWLILKPALGMAQRGILVLQRRPENLEKVAILSCVSCLSCLPCLSCLLFSPLR